MAVYVLAPGFSLLSFGCSLDTVVSSQCTDSVPSPVLARTHVRGTPWHSESTHWSVNWCPSRLCWLWGSLLFFFFFPAFSGCTMFLGFRKCHKNVGATILHFYLFLWHNCTLSEFVLDREEACDISKQTKIAALAVSCLPLTTRPLRWEERLSFRLKLKWKFWVSANIRRRGLSWQEALEMLVRLKYQVTFKVAF